jgi:DNA mismatch repair ATPase MutS
MAGYLYEYVNLLLLLDVSVFVWTVDRIRAERDTLAKTYAALGELDVIQGVATLQREGSAWARPEHSTGSTRSVSFTALAHPLLESPVPNSLTVNGQSVLLPEYVPYHVREEIVNGEPTFDYRLHEGRCSSRNALAILAAAGYPAAVLEDARAVADYAGRSGRTRARRP